MSEPRGRSSQKVVVSEFLHEAALQLLGAGGGLHYDPELYARPDELRAALQDAGALLVRNQTKVTRSLLEGTRVAAVGRVGVGLDNIELPAVQQAGVTVTWAPGTNATSVAEYVIGSMLSLARNFLVASPKLHAGEWDRQAAVGFELQGKTLGIVGLGDIGGRVARRAQVLGMRIVASDPLVGPNSSAVQEFGVELLTLEELLAASDVVSLHAPLLPSTRGMIGQRALASMKPVAYLINTARGGLVDESALAQALKAGQLAGAALDVRDPEPPGSNDPLAGLPNVLLTPHIAGVTEESTKRACLHVAEDVLRVLAGERPLSEVPAGAV
ncbi:MAG: hydroxyacid dehydrogenase [Trueperaceae bacterium]